MKADDFLSALILVAALTMIVTLCGCAAEDPLAPSLPSGPLVTKSFDERVNAFIDKLGDRPNREAARAALQAIGPEALPIIAQRSHDPKQVIRFELATLLGTWGDTRALTVLAANVLTDPDTNIRNRWLWAIDQYENKDFAIERFKSALGSNEEEVQWKAAVALASLDMADGLDKIHASLAKPDRRLEALRALEKVHNPMSSTTIALVYPDLSTVLRQEAVMSLAAIGDDKALELLIAALGDEEANVRWRACYALANVKDARAIPALRTLESTEQDTKVRQHLKLALKRLDR